MKVREDFFTLFASDPHGPVESWFTPLLKENDFRDRGLDYPDFEMDNYVTRCRTGLARAMFAEMEKKPPGFRCGHCIDEPLRRSYITELGEGDTCLTCDRLFFRGLMLETINNGETSKLALISEGLQHLNFTFHSEVAIDMNHPDRVEHPFLRLAALSLWLYLRVNNNETSKIGHCDHCDRIYIKNKKNKKQRFCSPDCRENFYQSDRSRKDYINAYKRNRRASGDKRYI